MSDEKVKVLIVEPMQKPYVREISGSLESMQQIVGGTIEAIYPFDDTAALVCNDEGKLLGLMPNRLLKDSAGRPYDMVCGTFFVVGLGQEDFKSLTDEQISRYQKLYSREMLIPMPGREQNHKKEKHTHER